MNKKREVIKKVIAYMTLGIDVSRLFTDMMMAIETKDIVVKKMVYLYLCTYAQKEPELAIMCINTLRRDCDNEDPMVRGVALRSICGLRLESILEYVELPLKKGLADISAYVRRTAVMGVLKVNYVNASMVETNNYVETLYKMLFDVDTHVVTNVIYVLNELNIQEGGLKLTPSILMHLLNRIGEFSEWGLNAILDLVCRYEPSNEDEIYAIMNLLDPVLRTTNSGAVLATIKCFLHVTANMPDLHEQIYSRTKPSLLTFVTGGQPEVQYAILKHLQIILRRKAAKGIYDDEYRQLYVRYNEPPHVKHLKVGLLPLLANAQNSTEISMELFEYVTDVDVELSKCAVRALADIAMAVHDTCAEITQKIVECIDIDIPHVRNESVIALGNILRIFPGMSTHVLPSISRCLRKVDDDSARAVIVWMIGEFCTQIIEAPYKIEKFIDNYDEIKSVELKLHLLTASMKLFFARPPEMQHMLGRLLDASVKDTETQDVHDRALFYYRILQEGGMNDIVSITSELFRTLAQNGVTGKIYSDNAVCDSLQMQKEFNSLSVIYGIPAEKYLDKQYVKPVVMMDREETAEEGGNDVFGNEAPTPVSVPVPEIYPGAGVDMLDAQPQVSAPVPATAQNATTTRGSMNLLDFDDFDGGDHSAEPASAIPMSSVTLIKPTNPLTPPAFQQMWLQTPEQVNAIVFSNTVVDKNTPVAGIEAYFKRYQVRSCAYRHCMLCIILSFHVLCLLCSL